VKFKPREIAYQLFLHWCRDEKDSDESSLSLMIRNNLLGIDI